ncbi:MAG: hypothetical protein ACMXX9_03225 [Candidatus Woesearchaeota archaeon]
MVYLQKTSYTTLAASLINVFLELKVKVLDEEEFFIWHNSANLPIRASSIYGVASYAFKKGLNVEVIVEDKEFDFPDYRFYRYTKDDVLLAKKSSSIYLNDCEALGIRVIERGIDFSFVKSLVLQKKILLLRLNVKSIRGLKKNSSNFLAILGFERGNFRVIDPKSGEHFVAESDMIECFSSLETKKHRSHKMIVFNEKSI